MNMQRITFLDTTYIYVANNTHLLPTDETKIQCCVCKLEYDRSVNRHAIYTNAFGAVNVCSSDIGFFKRMVKNKCRHASGLVNIF